VPDRDDLTSEEQVLPNVKNVIAVASGKGGVGKSTVAVNLAAGLSQLGARVGLFDADVYGPNVPRMVDADEPPMATEDETLVPPEKYGVKLMSMAFLTGEDDPVIWRGPMVHKVITQLTEDVEWGHLDYLVVDLPPGTGDTQLTMLQTMPVTGAVIVTTPQDVALDDARKGLEMFAKHDTVVLGIAENMSTFACPDCGGEHDIFGSGGGEDFAEERNSPSSARSRSIRPSARGRRRREANGAQRRRRHQRRPADDHRERRQQYRDRPPPGYLPEPTQRGSLARSMTVGGDDGSGEETAPADESEADTAPAEEFDPDPERVEFLREVADDVRGARRASANNSRTFSIGPATSTMRARETTPRRSSAT